VSLHALQSSRSQPTSLLTSGNDIPIDEHTYRILEVGVHGEYGAPENHTCRATRVNPDGTLEGTFIIKRTPRYYSEDPLIMKNTAIRLRAAHPEIDPRDLAVFECGEREPGELSVSRFIPGVSLKKARHVLRLNASPPEIIIQRSWETALRIIMTLSPLNKAGLIHRDVKDDNLIMQRDRIGLGDADSLTTKEEVHKEQDVNTIIGTPIIMTPEMILSRYNIDHTTDPYQAACTIYALLGGRLESSELGTTLQARVTGDFEKKVRADLAMMETACPESARLPMHRLKGWLEKTLSTQKPPRPQTMQAHWQLLNATPNTQEL